MPRNSVATRRQRIHREIGRLRAGSQRRYPEPLRRRIVEYARLRLNAGIRVTEVCAELGVSHPTVSRMLGDAPAPMRRVRLARPSTSGEQPATPVVRGPHGLVVEGLGIEDVATLFRTLS